MVLPKTFLIGTVALFGLIGTVAVVKKKTLVQETPKVVVQEIALSAEPVPQKAAASEEIPNADLIPRLFALDASKLPIVETVSYTSRVPWLKDRPAWIVDYATHYATSRHFIARSLNRKPDYFSQNISPGDRFNVFKRDQNIQFHLVIDLTHCRMLFYYKDLDKNEQVLLKTYRVGLGRVDGKKASGYLTPVGKYSLGNKIAVYKPGMTGTFQNQKTEMMRVFGTRWIPFVQEIDGCSDAAKGLGIHGAPWVVDPATGQLVEDRTKVGIYESDGCIRLLSEDMEELFAIIVTKPTFVELVKDLR